MPTPICPTCGHALADSSLPCPQCGKQPALHAAPAARSRLVPWLIGLPVGAFALLMLIGSLLSTPEGNEQWVAREAIKVCNKEVARAPEDRKRADLTLQDCADLETAFRAQFGIDP